MSTITYRKINLRPESLAMIEQANEVDLAWAAGLIDGEGCVSVVTYEAEHAERCTTRRYVLVLKVTMGHRPTVERIASLLGVGTVQAHVAKSARVNASYSWVAQSRRAEAALRAVRPYLVTKAKEADVALAFMALPLARRGGPRGSRNTPLALLRARERLYWKLRKMKPRWRFYEGRAA